MADSRKLKYGVNSGVLILIVAGILVAANVIGTRLFTRLDLTEDKEFTITDATKNVLRRLDDVVNCKIYMNGDLPDQLTTLEQTVEDIVREYEVYADGNLRVQYIDPSQDEEAKNAATSAGIPQLQVNVLEQDQYQIQNVFLGAALEYRGKTEIIPVLDTNTLEYDMTSTIVKLTLEEKPTIGFLQGHGERNLRTELGSLGQLLQERYTTQPVDLSFGDQPISRDIDVLVVPGPESLSEREVYAIDQYLMSGGRLFVLNDVITIDETQGLQARPRDSGLRDLLDFYGCEVEPALVMEHPRYSGQARFSDGYLSYIVPYPLWPKGAPGLLNPSHPITAQLESTLLPFTAPLRLNVPGDEDKEIDAEKASASGGDSDTGEAGEDAAQGAGSDPGDSPGGGTADDGSGSSAARELGTDQPDVEGLVLIRTTERAWTQVGRFDLNPRSPSLQTTPEAGESFPLLVGLTGEFRSYFTDRPAPARPSDSEGDDASAEGTQPAAPSAPPIEKSPETQVLVAGGSFFLTNQFLGMHPENALLLQNAFDWMTLGNDLIAIRSRGATARPFERELSTGQKNLIKYGNTFGIAAAAVLIGLLWNGARRRARQNLRDQYGA